MDFSKSDDRMQDPTWYSTTEFHDVFAALREEDPVHWTVDARYGHDYWFLTRYEDVKDYLLKPQIFSSRWDTRVPKTPRRYTPEERFEMNFDTSIARNDPPIHDVYRRPINKHFSVPAVARMRQSVEEIVDEIIAEVSERGECDFVEDVAGELPARVVFRLLGVPESDWSALRLAAWQFLAPADPRFTMDGDVLNTHRHGQRVLLDYTEQLALERRREPRDDFATLVGNMTIDGDPLSIHEMRGYFTTIIGGGLETTRNTAAVGTWLFLTNPDQRQLLIDDPELISTAVEEVLRWVSPARSRFRVAMQDVELHGRQIRVGDWVIASQSSANRDPAVFDRPHEFDIRRNPNPHLSFGEGIHLCLGRSLARLELSVFFQKVLAAFPDMQPTGEPTWIADNITTGFSSFPVTFTPQAVPVGA